MTDRTNAHRCAVPGAMLAVLAGLLAGLLAGPSAAEAVEVKEGGLNARFHTLPPLSKREVDCRLCAAGQCTTVTVKGRCTRPGALAALKRRMAKERKAKERMRSPGAGRDERAYERLRTEGRSGLQRPLREWSDHNSHDPGLTVLEAARLNPGSVRVEGLRRRSVPLPRRKDESRKKR